MKKSIKTADACLAALFTAVIAVISQISVIMPTGVPITFQTFVVALCDDDTIVDIVSRAEALYSAVEISAL